MKRFAIILLSVLIVASAMLTACYQVEVSSSNYQVVDDTAIYVGKVVKIVPYDSDGHPTLIYLENQTKPIEVCERIISLPMGMPVKLTIKRSGQDTWVLDSVIILE